MVEKMYRLVKYIGKDGTDKLKKLADIHSLDGELRWAPHLKVPFYFIYNDTSGKMLQSSDVEDINTMDRKIIFTTRNSIFEFEEVDE